MSEVEESDALLFIGRIASHEIHQGNRENTTIFRVRNWAREHGMKRISGQYFFDETQEAAFLSRRTMECAPRSARTIAKKIGWGLRRRYGNGPVSMV
jgi:hypothetical protein